VRYSRLYNGIEAEQIVNPTHPYLKDFENCDEEEEENDVL